MKAIPIIRAPAAINEAFGTLVTPLFSRLRHAQDQCVGLAALRASLLPKLLSGELRVPDLDRVIRRQVL